MLDSVLTGIQASLAALLGKMIGKVSGAEVQAKVEGMKGEKGEAKNEKGAPLGDPGGHLLQGLGYATKDARSQLKNKEEEANVNRFLEALQPETKDPLANAKLDDRMPGAEKREGEVAEKKSEAQENREARDKDVHREEQRDDARVQGHHETKEQLETREHEEAHQKEQQEQDQRDEEEKPGHGWVLEELEEEEAPRRGGLRTDAGVYTDNTRCKGTLEDGTRCLRKPVKGIGYCREHTMSWRPDLTPKA